MRKLFSIVLPIYKNEKNLDSTICHIMENLNLFPNYDIEVIMVNDGSPDCSWDVMKKLQATYPNKITIANLERNCGQGACTECCISLAKGDVVGVISADLQDPFELFAEMLSYWEQGYKFVYGVRVKRDDQRTYAYVASFVHKFMKKFIINEWPIGGSDFYILDRTVVNNYLNLCKCRNTSNLATFLFLTGNRKEVLYTRKKREQGKSGYNFKSRLNTLRKWVFYNSDFPLRFLGETGIGLNCVMLILLIFNRLLNNNLEFVLVLGGWILGCWGMAMLWSLGQYLWMLMDMNKHLPRYLISEIIEKEV